MLPMARHRYDLFSKEALLPAGAMKQSRVPPTHYGLRGNSVNMMKELI